MLFQNRRQPIVAPLSAIAALCAALCAAPAKAQTEQTLIIPLPPSAAAQEAQARAAAPRREPSRPNPALRQGAALTASRGGGTRGGRQQIVGTLGVITQKTPIYRNQSAASRALVRCAPGTYIALQSSDGNWFGVLMADGSTGWINKESVRTLDYQVVATQNFTQQMPVGTDLGDNFPRSSVPYFNGDPQALLQEARSYLGVRYVWGGNTFGGIDCSGFIKNVFGRLGYNLPRLGSDQMAYGVPVPVDQLAPGDRLYFGRRTERLGVKHTGLYIGNGYFIHASSKGKSVVIDRLTDAFYARIYVCARR